MELRQRKRAEVALIEERHLLQTLMDNLPDAIYFKDRESHFTRINKAHAKLFGLSDPAQAVGKTDFDFFTAEHAQEAYNDEQEIIRTGQPIVDKEEKETWPDGHVTWVSTTKMPLRDAHGNSIGTFGVSRDITERKQAEGELRERESVLRAITEFGTRCQTDDGPAGSRVLLEPGGRTHSRAQAGMKCLARTCTNCLFPSVISIAHRADSSRSSCERDAAMPWARHWSYTPGGKTAGKSMLRSLFLAF